MTKKIISPLDIEVKELERKIAPCYLNASVLAGVESYLGYEYNPDGIIDGSYIPPGTTYLSESLVNGIKSYLGF